MCLKLNFGDIVLVSRDIYQCPDESKKKQPKSPHYYYSYREWRNWAFDKGYKGKLERFLLDKIKKTFNNFFKVYVGYL